MGCRASEIYEAVGLRLITTPHGYGRQRPSFSVPRLGRGVHRPAAAALRSGAGDLGVAGRATSPRLRWPGIRQR